MIVLAFEFFAAGGPRFIGQGFQFSDDARQQAVR